MSKSLECEIKVSLVTTANAVPIIWEISAWVRAGGTFDRERTRCRRRKRLSLVDTTTTFDALEVPPLAGATGDFMIPALLGPVSDIDKTANRNISPLASIVLGYLICA